MRNDIDLEEFRRRLAEARAAEADHFRERRDVAESAATDEPEDVGDESVRDVTTTTELELANADYERVRQIEEALIRIAEGRFGECVECGEPIAVGRLRATPYAARCFSCAKAVEDATQHQAHPTL